MGSNGGLLSADRTCRQPIGLVESGPIGGCIGASAYAEKLGFKNVVAFDMGGTTAKCALVENGRFSVNSVYYANGYVKGFPIKSAVIDIVEVGSGGGSIAWIDSQNRLHVGPQSAGSMPGPVCYGRGGTEPTITDANLVLGRLNPGNFLGGEMQLDISAAKRAVAERVATPLGYGGDNGMIQMADGIISIATVIMAGAIRKISVEHGLDPRDFILFSYGGGGPLHACALAHELSIPTVVIPPEPGNFSAIGMLLADARIDTSKTFVGILNDKTVPTMAEIYRAMEKEAAASLAQEFGTGDVFFEHHAEMRYRGQRHNIKVPVSGLKDAEADPRRLRARLQAALRPCRRQSAGGISSAASVRVCALEAAGDCAPAARPGKIPAGAEAQNLYWKRGRLGGRADLSPRCVGAGLQRHRAGGDRRVRLDDGGLAGRSFRDRRAAGD